MAERVAFPEEQLLRAIFGSPGARWSRALLLAPDSEAVLRELRCRIDAALETLSYRERGILEMRYGLGDGHAYTLAEAGYVFNLTRERIRQIQSRSLEKLLYRADELRHFLESLDV